MSVFINDPDFTLHAGDVLDLLDQLEDEARQRAESLEAASRLDPGFTEAHYPLTVSERRELKRLQHAMAAAPDADTFVALAKGRPVHPSRLRPEHASALRRR